MQLKEYNDVHVLRMSGREGIATLRYLTSMAYSYFDRCCLAFCVTLTFS